MGDSLHCDLCGKAATVHLTQIVKNQIQKVDLCEECAQSKGVTDPEGFSLADLLAKSFAGPAEESDTADTGNLICEQCGSSSRDFKKSGRLGCAACYDALKPMLEPLIAGLHKDTTHKGKVPGRQFRDLSVRLTLRRELENVERELQDAVKQENFEAAARCRDQLGLLRTKLADHAATSQAPRG
jgi:protein arginine kinase activator